MTRYEITVTQVIKVEDETLQAGALAFPNVLAMVHDPDQRMFGASDPALAAQLLAVELYNHALKVLPGAQVQMPACQIDEIEEAE